jgi:hypothetical protein
VIKMMWTPEEWNEIKEWIKDCNSKTKKRK